MLKNGIAAKGAASGAMESQLELAFIDYDAAPHNRGISCAKQLTKEEIDAELGSEKSILRWEIATFQRLLPQQISNLLRKDRDTEVKVAVILNQKLKTEHILQALSDKDRYVAETTEKLHPFKAAYVRLFKMHDQGSK